MAQGQVTPKIGEDVTSLMPDVGEDVTALMAAAEAPDDSVMGRIRQLGDPSVLWNKVLKPAAWMAAGPGHFEDAAGGGATVGGLTGMALAPFTAGGSLVAVPALTAAGAAAGKVADVVREGKRPTISNVAPRVAGETALSLPGLGVARAAKELPRRAVDLAVSHLKPTITSGAAAAQRMFGQRALAPQASREVIESGLKRELLGGADPLQNVVAAQRGTIQELDKAIGSQPTRAANVLRAVEERGRGMAANAVKDIPGATSAIEKEILDLKTGRLGRQPLEFRGRKVDTSQLPTTKQTFNTPLSATPGGRPFNEIQQAGTPQLRPDITAREAWDAAKSLDKRINYTQPSSDLVDAYNRLESRGLRSSVKHAAREARPLLKQYGQEADLIEMLRNPVNREANKNRLFNLPAMLGAVTGVASGNPFAAVGVPLAMRYFDKTALQQAQRLYKMGMKPERAIAITMGVQRGAGDQLSDQATVEQLRDLLGQGQQQPQP